MVFSRIVPRPDQSIWKMPDEEAISGIYYLVTQITLGFLQVPLTFFRFSYLALIEAEKRLQTFVDS